MAFVEGLVFQVVLVAWLMLLGFWMGYAACAGRKKSKERWFRNTNSDMLYFKEQVEGAMHVTKCDLCGKEMLAGTEHGKPFTHNGHTYRFTLQVKTDGGRWSNLWKAAHACRQCSAMPQLFQKLEEWHVNNISHKCV